MAHDHNVLFQGSIPENYDRHLGPVFFEPYADDIATRLKGRKLNSVLEIACGTGIVTRRLRDALPATTEIVATDLNNAMFEFAQGKFQGSENVRWEQADASNLPFGDQSFDAVVCQFGIMFVPDKAAAMREAFRVLRNGGVFLFNVWGPFDSNPAGKIAHTAIASFFNSDPPKFYELPFGFYDSALIRTLLEQAGFSKVESFMLTKPFRSKSAEDFAIGLVRGNPVGGELEARGADPEEVIGAVEKKLAEQFGKAPCEGQMQAIVWQANRS